MTNDAGKEKAPVSTPVWVLYFSICLFFSYALWVGFRILPATTWFMNQNKQNFQSLGTYLEGYCLISIGLCLFGIISGLMMIFSSKDLKIPTVKIISIAFTCLMFFWGIYTFAMNGQVLGLALALLCFPGLIYILSREQKSNMTIQSLLYILTTLIIFSGLYTCCVNNINISGAHVEGSFLFEPLFVVSLLGVIMGSISWRHDLSKSLLIISLATPVATFLACIMSDLSHYR